jgi:hypothetical protein
MTKEKRIGEAIGILTQLGLPREQLNERTAICLLALLDLKVDSSWSKATNPRLGIRAILDFARNVFGRNYAENTRETVRDESIKPMLAAGLLLHNPDQPDRAVNSPKNCYQIDEHALALLRCYGSKHWKTKLGNYLADRETLVVRYAKEREMHRIPLKVRAGHELTLSAGEHSELIRKIIEQFAPRFVPGGELVYVGDTGAKWGYFDRELLETLGVRVAHHGKMPDVVIYYREKNWLILAEAVASSGPVDGRRQTELSALFEGCKAGLVFVTAFPNRGEIMRKFLSVVAWETEVWCASDPTHLIHFNGVRFLGPYAK